MTEQLVVQKRRCAEWTANATSFAKGVGAGVCGMAAPITSVWAGIHLGKAAFAATGSTELATVASLMGFAVPAFAGYFAIVSLVMNERSAREAGFAVVGLLSTVAAACYVPNHVWDSFGPTREVRAVVESVQAPPTRLQP